MDDQRDYGDENDWRRDPPGCHGYREPSKDELLDRDRHYRALMRAIARGYARRRHWLARLLRWLVGA